MGVHRIDSAVRLDGVKRTPQGGLRVDAALTRSGVLEYRQPNGQVVREYRPPEEVFHADSLATLAAAPVTNRHPPEMVSAANYQKYARGTVGESVRQDGDKVTATMYLQDAELVAAVERGDMREVSCGYVCDLVQTPGTAPSGERYDRVQTNIRYNHAAIVPVGRAGSEVALRLDASDNVIPPSTENRMTKERIDGVDYDVGSDAHRAACERRDAQAKAERAEREKLQARADAAEQEIAKLKKDAAELPAKLAAAAQARASLVEGARKVLGAEAKFDGKDDAAIRREVAAKANPEIKLDGKHEAYIEGLFDLAVARADESTVALADLHRAADAVTRNDAKAERFDVDAARQKMVERNQNAWQPKAKA